MTAQQRLPKPLKPTQSATHHINTPHPITPNLTHLSPATLIHLQRIVGNRAVQQMIQPPQSGAIGLPPDVDTDHHHLSSGSAQDGVVIQRAITRLPGASSGFFRKGRRDKINIMVDAYNALEIGASGSKRSVAGYQALLPEIRKIWQAAREWQVDVMKSSPAKAATIGEWMTSQVEREEDAKNAQIGELQEAAALKAASDGASYNVAYTTPQFTTKEGGAGVNWLATPALRPIYEYFMIQVQFENATLKAYQDVTRYKQNPSRDEALRIYHKYDMGTASQLNITGEGVTGSFEAINTKRRQMEALEADPTAAAPANFGAIEESLIHVVNELFIAFRTTTPFKKVTTPPAAAAT
jgi:hypothetical protein